jgi:hypothetical protein
MIIVMIAMGIDKMSVHAIHPLSGLVHQIHEGRNGPGNRFRDDIGPIVPLKHHCPVQHINEGDLFAGFQPHGG